MYISQKELRRLVWVVDLLRENDSSQSFRQLLTNRVMQLCDADYAASYIWNNNERCYSDPVYKNMTSDNVESYNQYYQFHDPITHKLSKFRRAVAVSEIMPHNRLIQTEFFNEFLKRDGLTYGVNLFVHRNNKPLFDFRLWRSNKKNDFQTQQLKILDTLLPSLRNTTLVNNYQPKIDIPELTPKECQALNLLRDGMSDKAIARALHISVSTLRTHFRNIFYKLDVHSRTELMCKFPR